MAQRLCARPYRVDIDQLDAVLLLHVGESNIEVVDTVMEALGTRVVGANALVIGDLEQIDQVHT